MEQNSFQFDDCPFFDKTQLVNLAGLRPLVGSPPGIFMKSHY